MSSNMGSGSTEQRFRNEFHMQFDGEPNRQMLRPDSLDFKKNLEFSKNDQSRSLPHSIRGLSVYAQDVTPPFNAKRGQHHSDLVPVEEVKLELGPLEVEVAKSKINQTRQTKQENTVFLYQYWPSNNRFFFNGFLMTGPQGDSIQNTFTWIMILVVTICFFVICAPYIWNEIHWLYVIFIILLFISTITFLSLTQFTEPGIVPRKEILEILDLENSVFLKVEECQEESKNEAPVQEETGGFPPRTVTYTKRKRKYKKDNSKKRICSTCQIVKLQRMSHCQYCGNCVQVFDHHCPFVNNCLGKRNYKYFIGFLISLMLLGICELCGFLILFISSFGEGIDNGKSEIVQNSTILVIILCVLCVPTFFFILCVFAMFLFHMFLVYKGKTTKEKLGRNQNIYEDENKVVQKLDWCGSQTESLFNPRTKVTAKKLSIKKAVLSDDN